MSIEEALRFLKSDMALRFEETTYDDIYKIDDVNFTREQIITLANFGVERNRKLIEKSMSWMKS